MFVPCLHEHGHTDKDVGFDHKIYSVNTKVIFIFITFIYWYLKIQAEGGESVEEAIKKTKKDTKTKWKPPLKSAESLFKGPLQGIDNQLPFLIHFTCLISLVISSFINTSLSISFRY